VLISEVVETSETHAVITTVWKMESARLIAGLTRIVRDIDLAEDLAHGALVAALEQWPAAGVPDRPGAWLMTAARHRAYDALRRRKLLDRKHEQLQGELEAESARSTPDLDEALDDDIGDDLLRLMFIACHPVLAPDARAALTLRLLGGLATEEIARAFLVPVATMAQRIVRAKRAIAKAQVPFEVPRGEDRAERLAAVLEVLYLIFNEGYVASAGDELMRPELCEEALRLGRVLAGLAPEEPEVHGLIALMELQHSRRATRVNSAGELVPLFEQDRSRWDRILLGRGLAALERADRLPGTGGPYVLQARIAACHARALAPDRTDWEAIVKHYGELAIAMPSPVVELNRAVAIAMARGPAAGLERVDALRDEPRLSRYHLLPAVRGDLLEKLGRSPEARAEFERAASLATNERERSLMQARAARCARA